MTEQNAPLISVVIPTYNRASLLPFAVESVLAQEGRAFALEVVIVDDGSTDDTDTVVQQWRRDDRVRIVRQANAGRSAARNAGVSEARGELLLFLDSDDELLPGALDAHARELNRDPEAGMTVSGYRLVDETGAVLGERRPWETGGALDLRGWLFDCYGMPGAVMHRRRWLSQVGGFDSACEIAEDWDLYLRMAAAGCPMGWVRQVTCLYRQHAGSSVHDLARHRSGALRAMGKVSGTSDLEGMEPGLGARAQAWTSVLFARKAAVYGDLEHATKWLEQAVEMDPTLQSSRRLTTLEFLSMPSVAVDGPVVDPTGERAFEATVAALATRIGAGPADVRRAKARVHMASSYAERRAGRMAMARRLVLQAVRLDPRWLCNRGTLAFLLRSRHQHEA